MAMRDREIIRPYPSSPDMRVSEEEQRLPPEWLELTLRGLIEVLRDYTNLIEDRSRHVDEYQPGSVAISTNSVQTTSDYEYDSIIESVLITGPPAAVCTVQLGHRLWNLTLPATGFFVIAPVRLNLTRDSTRSLTSATAGNWTMELMGYCDVKTKYV